MTTIGNLLAQGFNVDCHDLIEGSGFDFLASREDVSIEVECKMVSGDLGKAIHFGQIPALVHDLAGPLGAAERPAHGLGVRILLRGKVSNQTSTREAIAEALGDALRGIHVENRGPIALIEVFPLTEDERLQLVDAVAAGADLFWCGRLAEWRGSDYLTVTVSPSKPPIALVIGSTQESRFQRNLVRELKRSAKYQLSGDRAAILVVQLFDLHAEDLQELAKVDFGGNGRPTLLRTSASAVLNSDVGRRIHTLAFSGHANVTRSQLWENTTTLQTRYQAQGPGYFFVNHDHPMAGDSRYRIFSEPGSRGRP